MMRTLFALALLFSGCGAPAVGRSCDVQAKAGPDQAVFNNQALECPSRICVKPVDGTATKAVDTAPYCTAECASDSDCEGETRSSHDGSDKRCAGGFVCGVGFEVGPLCCKKICLCKDFLPPTGLPPARSCAKGASSCPNL